MFYYNYHAALAVHVATHRTRVETLCLRGPLHTVDVSYPASRPVSRPVSYALAGYATATRYGCAPQSHTRRRVSAPAPVP